MKYAVSLLLFCALSASSQLHANAKPSPNGITLPTNYKNWRVISVSHRVDNNTLRVILGNDVAITAKRAGRTKTWPDGTILGKVVVKDSTLPEWDKAVVPGELVHVEFMIKDSTRFKATGGWGFARWKGRDLVPHGEDKSFAEECFACHQPVKDRDYVFTRPLLLP